VTAIGASGLLGFEVATGGRVETILAGLAWNGLSTDGRALVVRRRRGAVVGRGVLDGRSATIDGDATAGRGREPALLSLWCVPRRP
jgi:hypothetical protein